MFKELVKCVSLPVGSSSLCRTVKSLFINTVRGLKVVESGSASTPVGTDGASVSGASGVIYAILRDFAPPNPEADELLMLAPSDLHVETRSYDGH